MAKSKATKRSPRLMKRGDVIRVRLYSTDASAEVEEVVRGVDILVHLANGSDVVIPADDPIEFVTDDISEELQEQIATLQSKD